MAVVLLMGTAAGTANAQVFVNVPTTTTLWGGTADFNAFGLASMTAPASGLILTGTAISTITGKPVRHLWYGDPSNGLCRMDPEVDAVAPPVNGIGLHQNIIQTCVGAIQAKAFAPGQLAFDGATNTIYTVDIGRVATGILRLHYDPAGDAGRGTIDPIHVDSLVGTQIGRNALGGCPQITDPKTGAKVPLVPDATAIGPDGNLYVGNIRDGAIIRIVGPSTFDPNVNSDCQNKVQIPILSADSRLGSGHTFGLGWVGHTLFGADNIAPWIMTNADQCLTPTNGNRICGAPAVSGALMPTEILGAFVPGPQAGAVSDAQYPNFPGNIMYFATFPNLTKVTNILDSSNMTVQTSFGGTFSFITGLTADPQDLNNTNFYVGVDSTQGSINGAAGMYLVTSLAPPPGPPLPPAGTTAVAGQASATVSWFPITNGQPITSYVVRTMFAPLVPGGAATPTAVPDVTVTPDPVSGVLATTTTVPGLVNGTAYEFKVEACNLNGCSAFSGLSNAVTPQALSVPSAPTQVSAIPNVASATVAWTAPASNGNTPITSSTVSAFDGGATTASVTTILVGTGTGAVVNGLVAGHSYTFSVHATNAIGNSPESALSPPITIPTVNTADMSLTMSVPASVNAGSVLTYTLTVHNSGPSPATQVTVTDALPAPLFGFTASQGICAGTVGGNTFSCNLGAMAAGSSATVTVSVALPSGITSISNSASVSALDGAGVAIPDPNTANNTASATTAVTAGGGGGSVTTDIQVGGSSNNGNPLHGTPVTYTWQIKDNQGTVAAPGVVFTATLPASFTFNSVSSTLGTCGFAAGTVTCQVGTINGGAAAIITVVATPTVAGPANSFVSTGSATFAGTDSNPANNSFSVAIGAQ
ncbi:MAG: DUF11 domain-containing protein [Acidobacteriia bacterium]|nr:DUF11 domain-containing protein [Terriglobia bacterium]